MYPRLPNIYRKFDGIEYKHWDWYKHKGDALAASNELKEEGYRTRVTKKEDTHNETYYAVWKYPITSIGFHREQENRAKLNLARMVERHSVVETGRF
jgi:hypothetical protein